MNAAVFDIETTDLAAIGAGTLLCAVVKPLGKTPVTFRADKMNCKPGHESKLVAAVIGELNQYDLLIGHFIEGFDIQWLRSRAKYFDLPTLGRPFVYDTYKAFKRLGYKTVPNRIGRPTASLGHATDFFGFENDKTRIFPREWWESVWQDGKRREAAMDKVCAHCYGDVVMTQKIYLALIKDDYHATLKRAK